MSCRPLSTLVLPSGWIVLACILACYESRYAQAAPAAAQVPWERIGR